MSATDEPAAGVASAAASAPPPARTLRALVAYFLRLGSSGFGGPIALVGYMRRDLVEDRRWYTEAEFQQALAVGQMMPGPLAAQVATWLGYLQAGALGAAAVAVPFVLPPFVFVTIAHPTHERAASRDLFGVKAASVAPVTTLRR